MWCELWCEPISMLKLLGQSQIEAKQILFRRHKQSKQLLKSLFTGAGQFLCLPVPSLPVPLPCPLPVPLPLPLPPAPTSQCSSWIPLRGTILTQGACGIPIYCSLLNLLWTFSDCEQMYRDLPSQMQMVFHRIFFFKLVVVNLQFQIQDWHPSIQVAGRYIHGELNTMIDGVTNVL